MNIITIIFIAFGLAMDAFAVSITSGFSIKSLKLNNALKIGIFFGLFQAIMPVIGWLAGLSFREVISHVDHWIAFGLLTIIGCKMIYESSQMEAKNDKINPLNVYLLLTLSIATSIDALAIGLTLSFLKVSIILPVITIGSITFFLSVIGVYIGNKFRHYFERKIEMVGGFILIGIGIKILIEHLT
ncbi:MAG TPA: manganese efflux pump [Candidatus Atribacteria bacterium]|nr:manganese efflux pump [Candidatus Atribacteria bacterium]